MAAGTNLLGRSIRYLMGLAIGITLCAGVSYGLVRLLTRGLTLSPRADAAAVREAVELRSRSNDLADLARECFAGAADTDKAESVEKQMRLSVRPRLNDLRQRLTNSDFEGPAWSAILRATDALSASASTPANQALRERAARAVVEAGLEAERRVVELHVNPNDLPPPSAASFIEPAE